MPAQTCAAHGTIGSMSIIQRILPAQRRPAQRKAWLPARSRAEPDADLARPAVIEVLGMLRAK